VITRIEGYLYEMGMFGFSGRVLVKLNGGKVVSESFGLSDIKQHKWKPFLTFFIILE
jgi:hypothetical protein